jgi:hypothetical protein
MTFINVDSVVQYCKLLHKLLAGSSVVDPDPLGGSGFRKNHSGTPGISLHNMQPNALTIREYKGKINVKNNN